MDEKKINFSFIKEKFKNFNYKDTKFWIGIIVIFAICFSVFFSLTYIPNTAEKYENKINDIKKTVTSYETQRENQLKDLVDHVSYYEKTTEKVIGAYFTRNNTKEDIYCEQILKMVKNAASSNSEMQTKSYKSGISNYNKIDKNLKEAKEKYNKEVDKYADFTSNSFNLICLKLVNHKICKYEKYNDNDYTKIFNLFNYEPQ